MNVELEHQPELTTEQFYSQAEPIVERLNALQVDLDTRWHELTQAERAKAQEEVAQRQEELLTVCTDFFRSVGGHAALQHVEKIFATWYLTARHQPGERYRNQVGFLEEVLARVTEHDHF